MRRLLPALLLLLTASLTASAQGWLFAGFKGNSADGVYFATSEDGYHWTLVNGGKPVLPPGQPGELMRDPFIQRAPDGSLVMVWTWSWANHTIGFSSSKDLVNWTPQHELAVMPNEPTAKNVWAPAIYWEPKPKRWLIFWSSTIPGRFRGGDEGDNGLNHRIFSTYTKDFQSFTPARVYFDPGYDVIDATLLPTPGFQDAPFHIVFKDERKNPLEKHLLTATAKSMDGPWTNISEPFSETWSEGAAMIPIAGGYLALYDHYSQGQHYGAYFTTDFKTWTNATDKLDFPKGMRHGSFLPLSKAEYERLSAMKPAAETTKP